MLETFLRKGMGLSAQVIHDLFNRPWVKASIDQLLVLDGGVDIGVVPMLEEVRYVITLVFEALIKQEPVFTV